MKMKLTDILSNTFDREQWERKGYQVPSFDIQAVRSKTAAGSQ